MGAVPSSLEPVSGTIASYTLATGQLEQWLADNDPSTRIDDVAADGIRGYLAHMLDTRASATANRGMRVSNNSLDG